jgi:hypothetical protein
MSWLINTTAAPTLTIAGVDYSNNLIQFQASDSSIVGAGIITTQGRLRLGELPGQTLLLDYSKTKFQRGSEVLVDLTIDGTTERHPRGSLLVIDSSYDSVSRELEVNCGCLLTMYGITDNVEPLKVKTDFELAEDCTFTDLNDALLMEQSFLYVDKFGVIQKRSFYGNDGLGSNKEAPAWVSVRDHTAISSQPLGVGGVVPDTIKVTYTWLDDGQPGDEPPEDPSGTKYTEDITESTYWLEHPANLKQEQKVCTTDINGVKTCTTQEIWDGKRTYNVTKITTDRTYYGATGGSTSEQVSTTVGPIVELNGSYYAELYSYEVARNNGNPSGVQLRGLENVTQGFQEKTYEYGAGGEVLKTVDKSYRNILNAMTASDWRASNTASYEAFDPDSQTVGGLQRGFLTQPPTDTFYISQQVTTEFEYYDDRTIETTTTLTSSADCNNTGIYPKDGARDLQNLDATNNGIKTTTRRTSLSGLVNPVQPDRIGDGTVGKVTKSATIENYSTRYAPTEAGSVTQELQVPYQVNTDTENEARERAVEYAKYTRNLIEGDSAGIRVAEAMRPEIFGFYPGMPFAFYDRTVSKVVRLRMNACGWGVTQTDALMSTDGVFIGESNGTVDIGSNV